MPAPTSSGSLAATPGRVLATGTFSGFSRIEGDRLNVDFVDANLNAAGDQDFVFKGATAFSGIGQVRFASSGTDRILQFNNDNDLQSDFEIVLKGFNANVLGGDFIHLCGAPQWR